METALSNRDPFTKYIALAPNSMPQPADEEEGELRNTYRPIYNPFHPRPVEVSE
jgi:hypothetical protein